MASVVEQALAPTQQVNGRFKQVPIDPESYAYGGDQSFAAGQLNKFNHQGDNALNGMYSAKDSPYADQSMQLAQQAATGQAPSVAQAQLQQGLNAANATQQGAAGGARGPAGLAMAQMNANANMAQNQQAVSGQAAQLRAQEMATGRQQLASGVQDSRGFSMGNRQLDNSLATGMYGLGNSIGNSIQQGNIAHSRDATGEVARVQAGLTGVDTTNSNIGIENKKTAGNILGGITGAVSGLAKAAIPL